MYEKLSRTYMVTDPEQCLELLVAPQLFNSEVDFSPIEHRLDENLADIAEIAGQMPILQAGKEHAATRRRLSEHLASRRGEMRSWVADRVPAYLAPFHRTGRFEAVADVLVPMFVDAISQLVGVPLPEGAKFEWVSLLFDPLLGPSKRKRVYSELRELQAFLREALEVEDRSPAMVVALITAVFGREPMVGTFGESFHRLISDHPGQRLSEISYPALPPATGVPFVDRTALKDFEYRGLQILKGAHMKLYLQSFENVPGVAQRNPIFGAGPHACPGRSVALLIWNKTIEHLQSSPLRASVVRYEANDGNYLFTAPRLLELELTT